MAYLSRRHLLVGAGTAGFAASLGALTGLGAQRAWAADTSGYKALVCIFLYGGMDHSDTVIPYDQSEYDLLSGTIRQGMFNAYRSDEPTSSRNRDNLLALTPTGADVTGGRKFALPPQLSPLHDMFGAGDLAIVGNVGPLIEPTTRAAIDAKTAILPRRLFSHNDQRSTWMSQSTEGSSYGWGGQFMDTILAQQSGQNPDFSSVATGQSDVFLSGRNTTPFRATKNGANLPRILSAENFLGRTSSDDEARASIRSFLAGSQYGDNNVYGQDYRDAVSRSIQVSEQMIEARQSATPFSTGFPDSSIAAQLKLVAETIQIQQVLNVSRQIFFVTMGGYDTHDDQVGRLSPLHSGLASAMAAFKAAMQELGRWNDVTLFTASDFGRTQIGNGDGTDHGWGGHQLVAGGAVRGGSLYGSFPVVDPSAPAYTKSRGRLIPSVSVEQYAATLGQWFGLSSSEINSTLPNLANFNGSDVGFMTTAGG